MEKCDCCQEAPATGRYEVDGMDWVPLCRPCARALKSTVDVTFEEAI